MRSRNYLSFFISSLSFLTFGFTENVKAITENNVKKVTKCSYDAAQYKSLNKKNKNKYCINKDNRVIEYQVYSSGSIYDTDKGELDIDEFQDNVKGKFLQKWSIENDKLVSYRCKMEGLSACEFNRVAIGEEIFFGYKGDKVFDKPNGKGTYVWKNGDEYVGDWVNGKKTGQGTFIWGNGKKYTGDWVDDKRTGKGTYTWKNGDEYVGDWVDNSRTGKGTFVWKDGNQYVGDWVDDKRTGKGTFTWVVGDKYVGDWVDGDFDGKGTYTWKNGDEYVGDWVDGQRTGKGTLTFVKGDKYEGDWVNGKFEGYGKYTFSNGNIQEGRWSSNQFIGSTNSKSGSPNSSNVEEDLKNIFKSFF